MSNSRDALANAPTVQSRKMIGISTVRLMRSTSSSGRTRNRPKIRMLIVASEVIATTS